MASCTCQPRTRTLGQQSITISETANLDSSEIERMVADAERYREEDAALRQIDARNELDSAAYRVERRLAELGDAVPVHEKARAERLVADARRRRATSLPLSACDPSRPNSNRCSTASGWGDPNRDPLLPRDQRTTT